MTNSPRKRSVILPHRGSQITSDNGPSRFSAVTLRLGVAAQMTEFRQAEVDPKQPLSPYVEVLVVSILWNQHLSGY
jgi:hypothetical protein